MSCLLTCLSAVFSCCPSFTTQPTMPHYAWTDTIHAKDITFRLVTSAKNDAFFAICDMYKLSEENLAEELENMVLWCVFDKENQPIGGIQLDRYSSLQGLKKQVSDPKLAEYLFSSKKDIELSYALTEKSRGKGLGSKAITAFINHAHTCEWGKHLFAVVSEDNQPSIRILEKNAFSHIGNYQHDVSKENIRLYAF